MYLCKRRGQLDETLATLKFCSIASQVRLKTVDVGGRADSQVEVLKTEVKYLRDILHGKKGRNLGETGSLIRTIQNLKEENCKLKQYEQNYQHIEDMIKENQILKSKFKMLKTTEPEDLKSMSNTRSFLPYLPLKEFKSLSSDQSFGATNKDRSHSNDVNGHGDWIIQPKNLSSFNRNLKADRRPSQDNCKKSSFLERLQHERKDHKTNASIGSMLTLKVGRSKSGNSPDSLQKTKLSLIDNKAPLYVKTSKFAGVQFKSKFGKKSFGQLIKENSMDNREKDLQWRKKRSRIDLIKISNMKLEGSQPKLAWSRSYIKHDIIDKDTATKAAIDKIRLGLASSARRLANIDNISYTSANTLTGRHVGHYTTSMERMMRELNMISFN